MKLFKHQQEIISQDPHYAGLFLGTGSGKTRVALCLAEGSTLVIAPKTQVEDKNWERELQQIEFEKTGGFPSTNISLGPLKVVSKDWFRVHHEELPIFDTVIGDEAHTLLGVTPNTRSRKRVEIPRASQTFEALEAYLERTKPKRLYLCTATIMRSPMTVWAAYKLLRPEFASQDRMNGYFSFRHKFYHRLSMESWREVYAPNTDSNSKNELARLVRELGYVGRLEDFFDVPAQTFKTEYVELTAAQKERLKTIKLEFPEPIVLLGKRHQIENGVLAGDRFNPQEEFANAKLEKILDYALEFPRMIVFAKYTQQIGQIRDAVVKTGKQVFVLTGDTKDRGALIAAATITPEYVFIAQAQISAGWQLPECPVMVFASRTYSWVDYDQAIGRIQRAHNIKKNLYINLVTKGGVDAAVDKSLINKQDFNERIYLNL